MPALSRNAPKLLHIVDRKQHATMDDHERKDFSYDPISSDYERIPSPPQVAPEAPTKVASKVSNPTRKSKKSIQAPQRGTYKKGRADKARSIHSEDKENGHSSSQSSTGKRSAQDDPESDMFGWGVSTATKRQRTANIHASVSDPTKQRQLAKKRIDYSSRGQSNATKEPSIDSLKQYANPKSSLRKEDDDSDLSDLSMASIPNTLRKPKGTKGKKTKDVIQGFSPQPSKSERASLLTKFGAYAQDATPTNSQHSASHNSNLPNLDPDVLGNSTPLSSLHGSSSHEVMEYFDGQALDDLSSTDYDDKCPLCENLVQPSYYWDFWKGKGTKTMHLQKQFCRLHTEHDALALYKQKGYPEIDWELLPARVENYHSQLIALLKGDVESHYRDSHAQKAEAGERPNVREMMASNADLETKTGYYGPRGRRAMMEAITTQLADVIRECAEKDKVVNFGGFANFVLRVLVPELTIRLVIEDCGCSEQMAKEIIQESGELGGLVHDEIEDMVRVESDAEEEEV